MREGVPTISDAIDAFLSDVAISCAPLTHASYAAHLKHLREMKEPPEGDSIMGERPKANSEPSTPIEVLRAIGESHAPLGPVRSVSVAVLTPSTCRALIRYQLDTHARSTARVFATVLQAFCRFCVDQGWYAESPMQGVPLPKVQERPHRWLTLDELARIRSVCTDAELPILGLLSVGLRVGEVVSAKVENIDDGLLLVKGKGTRYRYVPLPDIPLPDSGLIVPFTTRHVQRVVRRWGKRAGIPHLHPHLLRASWASHAIMSNEQDFSAVQAVGGWSDSRMLQHYSRSVFQKAAARKLGRFRLL